MELEAPLILSWKPEPGTLPPGFRDPQILFAEDSNFQVLLLTASVPATAGALKQLRDARRGKKAVTVVVAVDHGSTTTLLGPSADAVVVLPEAQARMALQATLEEQDELAAIDRLEDFLAGQVGVGEDGSKLFGTRNQGLFARHYLETRVPERPDWKQAQADGETLRNLRGLNLIDGLGFARTDGPNGTQLLSGDSKATRAVASSYPQWLLAFAKLELWKPLGSSQSTGLTSGCTPAVRASASVTKGKLTRSSR